MDECELLTALFEGSSGNPATNLGTGSWGPAGGFGPPPSGSGTLFQNVQLYAAVAY